MELKEILEKIKSGEFNYGREGDYYFFLDEDGYVMFLKRNHEITEDEDGESREGYWSKYEDEVIWEAATSYSRGLDITGMFLEALDIDYAE